MKGGPTLLDDKYTGFSSIYLSIEFSFEAFLRWEYINES